MGEQISQLLEPIAAWFRALNIPEPITHWGHPAMMGIVVFVMGGYMAWAGWQGRLQTGADKAKNLKDHKKIAPFLVMFIAMGYSGGVLSLVMQHQSIMESPHFWTGTIALGLLFANGAISASKFGGGKPALRTAHAYLGTGAMVLLFVHAIFGVNLGLSF